jgi:hypothetical protein
VQTKVDPGNKLDIYSEVMNNGIYKFSDTLTHSVKYEVTDAAGNISSLSFKVKSEKFISPATEQKATPEFPISNFNYSAPNHFNNGSVNLDAPRGVFYDSFQFKYDSAKQIPGTFSVVHKIHDKYTPVQDYMTLSIKARKLPEGLQPKAVIVKVGDDGKTLSSMGGEWEGNGSVSAKIREFGNYTIAVDTIPPKVKAANSDIFQKMAGQKYIKLTISDELSGIASYKGMLNGKWILMEYDAKNDLLIYTVDELLKPGTNTLLVEVRDGKGNRAYYSAKLNL